MDREALLVALVALVCGPLAWVTGPILARGAAGTGIERERRAWRLVLMPLVITSIGVALLLGWALREPASSDERISILGWVVVGMVGLVWVRGGARLVRGNLRRHVVPIGVVGLLRPRIVIDPEVARSLDEDALAAALAHEQAHLRHRDPMRIAIANLAADLQWPWPQARVRLRAWHHAMEEARDDEAVANGANPDDLAAAILAVARFGGDARGAALTGAGALERRIARLVEGECHATVQPSRRVGAIMFALVLATALLVGIYVGEDLIAFIPGVVR